jgi:LysM repeat protein
VQKGDTLANLALRFLGDRRRHRALASINHLDSPQALSTGSNIKIPFDVPHIVKKGESLAMIADRYYGDPKKFDLIASYNFLTDPRAIKPGTEILVPIVNLEIVGKSTPKSESAKALLLPEEQVGFLGLERGINLYLAGEYRTAVQSLREAVKRGLEREDDICKAYRFLAYSHIALGETDLGKRAFERALVIRPNLELDPTYISPKIMRIFAEVKAEKRK